MDQEEHLAEQSQQKFFTRSTARHLRRKRLHDARRAEKQEECLIHGSNVKFNQEFIIERDTDQPELITKSKARRLQKRSKTQVLQNCCSFCESYCRNSLPVIETVDDQDVAEKDLQDVKTITKSKARRLRKKNKSKLVQNTCSFCYDTYSPIDPILLKYIKTADYDSVSCAKLDTDVTNNLKQNYKLEKAIEAQVCHEQYDKKLEQTELIPENVRLQENCSELSCLSRSPGLCKFENEVQIYHEKHDKDTKDLVLTTELKQKIVETIQTKINYTKEDTKLQKQGTQEFDDLERSCNVCNCLEEINLVKLLKHVEYEEILEAVKRLEFTDSPQINLQTFAQENTQLFSNNIEPQDESLVITKNRESTNPIKEQSETESVLNSDSTITQNYLSNLNSFQEGVTTKEEVSSERDIDRLSNTFSLESTEPDKSGIAPSLTSSGSITVTDNKMNVSEKTREEVKAEREAKKAAKALAKLKGKNPKAQDTSNNKLADPDSTKSSETSERTTNEKTQLQKKTSVTNKTSNSCTKSVPSEVNDEGKSKAELRAERRAKQEAQRAAKQQQLLQKNKVNSKETDDSAHVTKGTVQTDAKKIVTPKKTIQKDNTHEINLFKHLYHEREKAIVDVPSVNSKIHPVIVRLGTQYAKKVIVGSNARCVALLAAVKRLIQDFERPSQADFIRGLEASLQESVAYLHHCRPLAVSMQNALRHLKRQMTQFSSVSSDADAKSKLSSGIDTYIQEQIQLADKAISITIQTKISNGDVILTYGYSSLIHKILLDAHIAGKQFRVVVVDGRPWLEGKEQLRRLTKHGIECSYILINALSYVMPEVSKVFLGAHAILANGAVMSRVGTAQVALMAKAFNIPVLVACETHKSCERVQTDSIVYNELGNANELAQGNGLDAKKSLLANWKTKKSLNLLNITYDVTPADLVTAVVTELAILPCTSVPVILRIKPTEI
ncbi:translation initiation factor eIF-2B subunit delta [Hylaeus volcanicus]|uniref:translation initiation factor eIF-2B subunit delta n=1 Tax=Hylaeus volcanicus TaxID=313075 RepID=UPI0023B80430|nr:translation initiation factor eIF-2B subunit delta [Hylaeus volcanicus]XP_053977270.1 translation initiation factor eIF-2B subunit delta [Hylaeus volcanicus]